MARLQTHPSAEAEYKARQLFASIKRVYGAVPNLYADMGRVSPLALEAGLQLEAMIGASALSKQDMEALKLAVSEVAGCDYCLAAHTAISRKAGLRSEAIVALRQGVPCGHAQLDALAGFARTLVTTRGRVPPDLLAAVRQAGYSDAQIVEALLVISAVTFTNLFNRVNETALDFPPAD